MDEANLIGAAMAKRLAAGGPRVTLPVIGPGAGALSMDPSPSPRGRGPLVGAVGIAVVGALAVGGVALARSDDDPAELAAGPAATSTTVAEASSTTAAGRTTTTTEAPTTTTTAAEGAATAQVPVDELPVHEAVYRDGKLHLQGTLPSRALAERLEQKAAEVIGADNVVADYQIDPRVPAPTDGRVRVDESFLFRTGSSEVDPAYFPVFDLGVAALVLNPQATMRIVGHTDDTGDPAANRALSLARAQAGADHLVAAGIDPSRLEVVGRGPDEPIASNDTEAGRAENRRVEVVLLGLLEG